MAPGVFALVAAFAAFAPRGDTCGARAADGADHGGGLGAGDVAGERGRRSS